jgi:hypothetical protein
MVAVRPQRQGQGGQEAGKTGAPACRLEGFFKSMTTYADHRVWQDIYHSPTPIGKTVYITITLRDTAPVIQFKER